MAMKIILKEEDIVNAKSYVPLMEKEAFVQAVAPCCIDQVDIIAKEDDFNLPMPPFYKDNLQRKSRYMMGALVRLYLGFKYEPTQDDYLMAADDYDRYAGSHIFNQLERFKSNQNIRDKVYDILYDLKDLEKRLNTEIYNNLQIMNDPAQRVALMISMQTTPEVLRKGLEALSAAYEEYDEYAAKKAGGASG